MGFIILKIWVFIFFVCSIPFLTANEGGENMRDRDLVLDCERKRSGSMIDRERGGEEDGKVL
jgi:hypothetical protein